MNSKILHVLMSSCSSQLLQELKSVEFQDVGSGVWLGLQRPAAAAGGGVLVATACWLRNALQPQFKQISQYQNPLCFLCFPSFPAQGANGSPDTSRPSERWVQLRGGGDGRRHKGGECGPPTSEEEDLACN